MTSGRGRVGDLARARATPRRSSAVAPGPASRAPLDPESVMAFRPLALTALGLVAAVGAALWLVADDALVDHAAGHVPSTSGHATSPAASPPVASPRVVAPEVVEAVGAVAAPLDAPAVTGRFGPEVPEEGRTAHLTGTIRVDGTGTRATLRFLAGPNAGTERVTEADGTLDWPGLYPGFGLLEVEAGWRCTREVTLTHRRADVLDLDLTDRGVVHGRLVDEDGEPVAHAPLTVDGVAGTSDEEGRFAVLCAATGAPQLVVRAPGFVPYREHLREDAPGGAAVDVELRRGASLDLHLNGLGRDVGGEVLVYLLPASGERLTGVVPRSAYPWHELNPLRLPASGSVQLHDLPACKLEARAFHPRAVGRDTAWLRAAADAPAHMTLTLEEVDAGRVRVVRDGAPVPGARAELRFANPIAATLGALGPRAERLLASQALELLPATAQEASTQADGSCSFGLDRAVKGAPFVTVTSPSGDLVVTQRLERRGEELVVDLARPGA